MVIAGIAAVAIVGWLLISFLVSHLSGWSTLAKDYAARRPFVGERWPFQSAAVRWILMSYNNGLTFGADREGFYVSVMFLLRPFHPPLFIPWSDVKVQRGKFCGSRFVRLRFEKQPFIPVVIGEKLANRMAEQAGGAWPETGGPA